MDALEKTITYVKLNIDGVISSMKLKEITNEEEYRLTGEWRKKNKETQKYIDQELEPIRKARYDRYKEVQQAIKELKKPLIQADQIIQAQRLKYDRKKQEEARKAKEELMRFAQTSQEEKAIVAAVDAEHIEVEGISHTTRWDVVVTDISKIPKEYLIIKPDMPKLRRAAVAMQDEFNIPGCKAVQKVIERVNL